MDVQLDPATVESAEKSIDEFIELRARGREKASQLEAMWAESERKHAEKRHIENRDAWVDFHLNQAVNLEQTAAWLAAEHRSRARALLADNNDSRKEKRRKRREGRQIRLGVGGGELT